MASTKELKVRITSAKETEKITKAMQLIASTKLRRARQDREANRPYFQALRHEVARIFQAVGGEENRYLARVDDPAPEEGPWACLLITSDRGMAGAYNKNVLREVERLYTSRPGGRLFVCGRYGVQYFEKRGVALEESFSLNAYKSLSGLSRRIGHMLLEGYEEGRWSAIYIVFTDMKNSLMSEVYVDRILPFAPSPHLAGNAEAQSFAFVPSPHEVLSNIVQNYVSGFVYSAFVDSYCSEQNARMAAMDTATENAERLLDELSLQYNRLRQSIITQEIIEISAGAKAQRAAHEKEGSPS